MARATERAHTSGAVAVSGTRGRVLAAVAGIAVVLGTLSAAPVPASASSVSTGCSAPVATGAVHAGRFLGVVRPVRGGSNCSAAGGSSSATSSATSSPTTGSKAHSRLGGAGLYPGKPPLINHGGPVMATPAVGNQVVVTPIYWSPSGYSFTSSYKNVINTYLADLAADSDTTTNVFATTFQYSGNNGAINDRFTRGTPITDTDAFPGAGCTVSSGPIYSDATGYSTCLDDTQLTSELDAVVAAHGLTRDLGHMYLLFLPKAVESCYYAGNPSNQQCSINSTSSSAFCAYHSGFSGGVDPGEVVYADMPFPIYSSATHASCTDEGLTSGTSQIQQPNGDPDADVEISPLSHEMAEAITDPEGNAWYDSSGYENGDDCAYIYGALSGAPGAYYNQTINGHHYLTQEEFSNSDYKTDSTQGCQQSGRAAIPTVTAVAPATGPDSGGTTVTITGTGFPGVATVTFGSTPATFSIVDATHITATAPAGTAGTVDVTVSTSAGTSATSGADHYVYSSTTPVPSVTGVSPASGSTAGGGQVTVTGTNLTGATAVRFGSTAAAGFTVTDAGHLTATTPPEAAGTVDVTVTTSGGTSPTTGADQYTFTTPAAPVPSVEGVSPGSGPTAGGTRVTITGTHLTGATAVRFGSTAAAGFTVTDDGHVTATAPAGAATTVDVTVTTAGGTSATGTADHYRYLRRPHVTSLSHGSGRRTGGAKVVVIGTGFRPGAVVRFGRTRAATVTVKSSTRIVVRAPRHARGTVDVVVATGGGSSPRVRRDRFRYV